MAEQKVKLTQLPLTEDTSDSAQLLVNQSGADQRIAVTHFLRAKNSLADIEDNVKARANLGIGSAAVLNSSELMLKKDNQISSTATPGSILKFGDTGGSPSVNVNSNDSSGIQFNKSVTNIDDFGVICANRKADNKGGTPGYVGSAIRSTIDVTNKEHSQFEWSIIGIVNNHADKSENVGIYAQGNKHGKGGTWGGVWEVCDFNDRDSSSGDGLTWGGEIDVWTDYNDKSSVRKGLSIVVGSKVNVRDGKIPGQKATASCGINITSYGGNFTYAGWESGLMVDQVIGSAIKVNGGGTRGIEIANGNYTLGIDLSSAKFSGAAIRLDVNQSISFDKFDGRRILVDGGALQYVNNGKQLFSVSDDGSGISSSALQLNNRRVSIDASISSNATQGGGSALPGTTSGYISIKIDGVVKKIPYFNE